MGKPAEKTKPMYRLSVCSPPPPPSRIILLLLLYIWVVDDLTNPTPAAPRPGRLCLLLVYQDLLSLLQIQSHWNIFCFCPGAKRSVNVCYMYPFGKLFPTFVPKERLHLFVDFQELLNLKGNFGDHLVTLNRLSL